MLVKITCIRCTFDKGGLDMGLLFQFVKETQDYKLGSKVADQEQMNSSIKNFIDEDVFQLHLYLEHLLRNEEDIFPNHSKELPPAAKKGR
jgi:hypothetical protein